MWDSHLLTVCVLFWRKFHVMSENVCEWKKQAETKPVFGVWTHKLECLCEILAKNNKMIYVKEESIRIFYSSKSRNTLPHCENTLLQVKVLHLKHYLSKRM